MKKNKQKYNRKLLDILEIAIKKESNKYFLEKTWKKLLEKFQEGSQEEFLKES